MSSTLPSDEVAEDYKNSLEDLTLNSRYEIGNLTVIAKENMDHALAISRVIENHIRTLTLKKNAALTCKLSGLTPRSRYVEAAGLTRRQAPPNRKLPALYVLDSVVKNVGTPYTLFFGRNLYQTYMTAYALVDAPIRKKLEEMLKTWKEPVPGSLDPRPVFPPEVTRTIENALIKARTAAVQLQQQQVRAQIGRSSTPYRSTPTPPTGTPVPLAQNLPIAQHQVAHATNFQSQARTTSPYATTQGANGAASQDHATQPSHSNAYSASLPAPPAGYLSNGSYVQQDSGGIDALMGDIINLIASARLEFATNPYDSAVQQRLKALLDLQTIVQTQALPPGQLRLIKDQVAQLSRDSAPLLPSTQPVTTPAVPQVSQASSRLQPPQHNASLQSILSPSTLAQLLASANAPQQTTSLQPSPALACRTPTTALTFDWRDFPPRLFAGGWHVTSVCKHTFATAIDPGFDSF
ncbi:MAG: hypothetical protein M1817_004481 [Caeruleum heppii]|nr:MAG: hypothetical protein M1817_004481 [Caeruleum heppii]